MPNDSNQVSVTVVRTGTAPPAVEETAYRAFADALPDTALMVFGKDLRYQVVAGAGVTRFGWRRQDIVGRRPRDVLPLAEATALEEAMQRVLSGEVRRFERGGVHDPASVWSITMTPLVTPEGSAVGGMIVAREVSEARETERARRQAEQRCAVALAAAPVFVFTQDRALRYTWANRTLIGHSPELLAGRTDEEVFPAEAAAAVLPAKRTVLETGIGTRLVFRVPAQSGTRYFDMTLQPARDDTGAINGIVGAALDVTDREADRRASTRAEAVRAIAEELQRGLLPGDPPDVDGFTFAVAYHPANETAEVGGDWYDVLVVPRTGAVVVVVGDVEGHDARAASVMVRVSSVIRAEASRGEGPAAVLAVAESFLLDLKVERMVTAAVASVFPATGEVVLASAGHPPPLLGDGAGVRVMDVDTGPPLGAGPVPRSASRSSLPPGGVMLFYTDGLLGPRLAVDEALDELGACLSRLAPGAPLDKLVDDVIRRTAGFQPSDDVAVVAMRRLDPGAM